MKIDVIIPAINEEDGIGAVLDAIPRDALRSKGHTVRVLVVDGNSTDRTREIAEEKGAVIIIEPRKGYGRAYKTGFEKADGDIIATADADGTYPVEDLPELVDQLLHEKLDFITTNRFARTEDGAMSFKHWFGNTVLNIGMWLLFFTPIKDSQSGMWVFRRSILTDLTLTSDGMPLSEEIKIEAFRNVKAKEVPITYKARIGEVKLQSWNDGWKNLKFLLTKRLGVASY